MPKSAYAEAGVDIELGNRLKATLPSLLASTHRRGVLGKVGGFGGLFQLDVRRYREPVLVSSVDGVGTKLRVAFAVGRHDTIGQDLVNHCVNDIAVLGAEPLFFLDYLGTGKLEPDIFRDILRGFAKACTENRCALIGGETAQMPGFYQPGEYDVSGTIVGVVEKSEILTGREIIPGDVLLGVASNGLHTNGYSLARKVFFEELGWKPADYKAELGSTLGDELLKVHRSYGPLIGKLLKRFNKRAGSVVRGRPAGRLSTNIPRDKRAIRAFAHITGGGFIDNIPRVLPRTCDAVVGLGSWPVPPVFGMLRDLGRLGNHELFRVFNMGIGLVAVVASEHATPILRAIRATGFEAWVVGGIRRGTQKTRLE